MPLRRLSVTSYGRAVDHFQAAALLKHFLECAADWPAAGSVNTEIRAFMYFAPQTSRPSGLPFLAAG